MSKRTYYAVKAVLIGIILICASFIALQFAFPPSLGSDDVLYTPEEEIQMQERVIATDTTISEEETAMEARWAEERIEDAKADIEAVNAMIEPAHERPAAQTLRPDTMEINGNIIDITHIKDPYSIDRAPDGVAATFMTGDGCTTDGEPTYFIGHNPGVFAPVIAMTPGDTVTVRDKYGDTRTYEMVDRVTIDRDTWVTPDVRETLFLDGESISLQACDGAVMRVIRCKAI